MMISDLKPNKEQNTALKVLWMKVRRENVHDGSGLKIMKNCYMIVKCPGLESLVAFQESWKSHHTRTIKFFRPKFEKFCYDNG